MAASSWRNFPCNISQLSLDTVLACGQSFRWKQNTVGEWLGVLCGRVWRLKQTQDKIYYQVYGPEDTSIVAHTKSLLNSHNQANECKLQQPKAKAPVKQELEIWSCTNSSLPNSQGNAESTRAKLTVKKASKIVKSSSSVSCTPTSHDPKRRASVKSKGSGKHDLKVDLVTKEEDNFTEAEVNGLLIESQQNNEHYNILHDYFQLDIDLNQLYQHWSTQDAHFSKVASHFRGVRMLRQDPVENLLSFVCSSNNHINRISGMVERLCTHYGDFITTVDGIEFYSFPSLSALCGNDVESHLRELGFGYRAKFISAIARHVTSDKGGDQWVRSLRELSYEEAKAELTSLLGVGAKVADCVCLMSLDKPGAIPVDTHVWQITLKHYITKLNTAKSLTDKIYNEIGTFYRNLWGPYAGWAHSVLFAADLRHNKERAALVEKMPKKSVKAGQKLMAAESEKGADISSSVTVAPRKRSAGSERRVGKIKSKKVEDTMVIKSSPKTTVSRGMRQRKQT